MDDAIHSLVLVIAIPLRVHLAWLQSPAQCLTAYYPGVLMEGSPASNDNLVTLSNWQSSPWNRWAFSHMRELVPTQPIRRARSGTSASAALIRFGTEVDLDPLTVHRTSGATTSLAQLWEDSFTDAIVVAHNDEIVYERYFGYTSEHTQHLLMSVTKSVVGCVAGVLIGKSILNPDDQLTSYIPELRGSGYDGATVRNVLDMRSGVAFNEDYTNPDAEVRVMEQAFGWRPPSHDHDVPRSIYSYLTTLTQNAEHGGVFTYRSCETLALGWACERASGRRMADLISEYVWAPIGAEHDAEITCDSVGTAIHDGGMCATARDMLRFGTLMLHKGRRGEDNEVIPTEWLRQAWKVDPDIRDAFAGSESGPFLPGGWYRNQFWMLPRTHGDVLLCLGINGQMIYVNPGTKTVAVKFSTWPSAQDPELLHDTLNALDSIGASLAGLSSGRGDHEGPGSGLR